MKASDICIVVSHSEAYQPLADVTVYRNLAEYCATRGYDLSIQTQFDMKWNAQGHAGGRTWARLDWVLGLMRAGQYKWIFVLGVDALVTNHTIKLEDLIDENFMLIAAADPVAPIQADSLLFKCCGDSMLYIKAVLEGFDRLKTHVWVENERMIELLPKYRERIKIVPQRRMNAYDFELYPQYPERKDYFGCDGHWQPGDFVIHYPGIDFNVRLREVNRRMAEVRRY